MYQLLVSSQIKIIILQKQDGFGAAENENRAHGTYIDSGPHEYFSCV